MRYPKVVGSNPTPGRNFRISTNHSKTNRNLLLDHNHGLNYSNLNAQRLVSPVFRLGVLPGLVGPSNDHVTDGFQSESDEWRIRVPI